MIVAGQRWPILIATRPVDSRCGLQALAPIVQTKLKLDPHSGVTVVFRSKRGDRLKILVWDGTGLVLVYKVVGALLMAWMPPPDGIACAIVVGVKAITKGRSIHGECPTFCV